MSEEYWKREAQAQAAAAGEFKMLLTLRLEELQTEKISLQKYLILEDNDLDRVILQWKIEQLQKHIEWFESALLN